MYKLRILPAAEKDLDALPHKVFTAIKSKVLRLSDNPRPYGVIKLTNDEAYRIRLWDYRVLYRINDKSKEVFIYRIKHRKEAYR
jgi:mRNA interferase RelE/StbE